MASDADDEPSADYNEEFLASGSWIDAEFLEDVLRTNLGEDIKVVDHEISAAVGAGNNYLSILYKTLVNYTVDDSDDVKTLHIMVKGLPTFKFLLDMIEDMGVFRKEIDIYTDCLPAMHKLLREYFPDGTPYVAPDSYLCNRENTLVMEDLQISGFKMAKRQDQLDYDHCVATLQTLARFHALSVKLFETNPDVIWKVAIEAYAPQNKEKIGPFFESCIPLLAQAVQTWEERDKYADDLREIAEFMWEKLLLMVGQTEHFNVLAHGDLWSNNIMYKYDEDGHVELSKLVDFQLSRYTSPVMDLHYFFFSSVQPDVLSNQMFELMDVYHEALTSDLTTLGLEVDYPIQKLHQDMRERAAYGMLILGQVLPLCIAPPEGIVFDTNEVEEITGTEDSPYLKNFQHDQFIDVCGRYLDQMDRMGYIQDAKVYMQHVVDAAKAAKEAEQAEEEPVVIPRSKSANRRRVLARLRSTVWRAYSNPIEE